MKTFLKSIIGIIFLTILILFIIVLILWLPEVEKHESRMGYKLTEEYIKIGNNYVIGKQINKINICKIKEDNTCLDGNIKGLKFLNKDILFYFDLNNVGAVKTIDEKGNEKILYYNYINFINVEPLSVKNINDIPKFGYISNNELRLYSKRDLENLSKEKQKIFKELERNPTIIIDGIDYTK